MASSQLQIHRYASGQESRVVTTLPLLKSHLFRLSSFSLTPKFLHILSSTMSQLGADIWFGLSFYWRYQGHVSAALVLGGVDCTGPHLHTVRTIICMILHEEKNPKHDAIDFVMHRFIHLVQQTHYHLSQWVLGPLLQCLFLNQSTKKGSQ
jgi:hypothetical protein